MPDKSRHDIACQKCQIVFNLSGRTLRRCKGSYVCSKCKGSRIPTPELNKKRGDAIKARWASDADLRERKTAKSRELAADPAHRAKISYAMRDKWQDPAYARAALQAINDKWQDPSYRAKMSAELDKRNADPTYRSKISKSVKTVMWSDEVRAKVLATAASRSNDDTWSGLISGAMVEKWKEPEYRSMMEEMLNSPEAIVSRSEAMGAMWQDPDFRERMLETWNDPEFKAKMRVIWDDPEYRQASSERSKALWSDEEYRAKMGAIFSSEEYRDKIRALWRDDEYREKMAIIRANQSGKISSLERKLYDYLDILKADYSQVGPETRIGFYVFDCLIRTPEGRQDILVECQGDYWHTLPGTQSRDRAKFTYIDRYFPEYKIIYFWQSAFDSKDGILDRLKAELGLSIDTEDFDFSDITIRESGKPEVRSFLDSYHYIGGTRGGVCYGAYLGDQLIACCMFSPPVRQNLGKYGEYVELSRFCIHPRYHKRNFATWLISRCVKLIKSPVVSYCDTTVGHTGTIYKAANFQFIGEVPPDYWYVNVDGYVVHKRSLYQSARSMKMTENQYAEEFGMFRKYGGKKLVFGYGL